MAEVHSIEIKVDSTQAQTASRNLDKMSGSASGAESALNNLTRAALGLVALDKIAGVAKGILDTNRAMEALRAQLVSVTGSAIGAQKAFTFIQNFATSTPYEIEGLTKAFITLQNYGIKPTKQVMEAVTNQASKLGGEQQTLEGIVRALGQAYAKGKLQAEEMLQLAERGVPVYDLLSQVTGKNAAQLQDMAQKGELTRDVLERLIGKMGELSSGANANAMDTLNGKISNLSDAWHQFEDALLNDKSEGIIKSIVDSITGQLSRMTAEINKSPVQKLEDQLASLRKTPGYDVPIAEVERQLASAKKAQEEQDKITAEQMKAEDARVAKVEEQRKKLLAGDGAVVKSKKEQTAATKALHEAEAAFSATIDANIRVAQNQVKVQEAQYKTAEKRLNLEMEQAKAAASIRMDTAKTDEDKLKIQEELAAKIESIIVRETELKQEQISLDEKIIATRIAGVEQEIASADRFNLSQAERIRLETELQALKAQEQIIPEERAQLEIDAMLELQNAYGDLNKLKAESADTEAKVREEALRTLEVLSSNLEYSREMAAGLAEAFGEVGAAIGGMSVALAEYEKQSATIEIARTEAIQKANGDQKKIDEANTTSAKKQATAQIKSYGDMTKAAQGFFKKGTAGYEAMGAATKVFRAFEMAQSAMSFAKQLGDMDKLFGSFETMLKEMGILSDINRTKEVVNAQISGNAKAAEGAANQGSSGDPYTAFARVAAWVALMASIGFMVGGGSGSKPGMSVTDIQDQQDEAFRKSTATMLGSNEMSTSILDALEIVADNSTNDLDYTKGMARNMELLVGSIESLSTAIATSFNFDVSKLNLGTVSNPRLKHVGLPADPLMSAIVGGLIGGTKTNRALIDQGISVVKQTIGQILDSGIVKAGQYANILVTKTDKALFGMFSSTSQSIEKQKSKLDPTIKKALGQVFDNAYATLVDAGELLGKGGAEFEKSLKEITVRQQELKLGKDAKKNSERIQAWLSSQLDLATELAFPDLKEFRRVGEGMYATSIRVADGVAQAQQELGMLGMKAIDYTKIVSDQKDQIDVGTEITRQTIMAQGDLSEGTRKYVEELQGSAKDIAESYRGIARVTELMRGAGFGTEDIDKTMINAAGGLSEFEAALVSFRENFMTDEQRLKADTEELTKAFAKLGYAVPTSKDQFYAIAMGMDRSTEEGKKLFAQFMTLNPAFAEVTDAAKELADAQAEAAQASLEAARKAREEAEAAAKKISQAYEDAFFTPEEKTAKQLADLKKQFDALGVSMPDTKEGLRKFLDGLNLLVPAQEAIYNQIVLLAPAFANAADAAASYALKQEEAARKAREAEYEAAKKQHDELMKALEATASDALAGLKDAYQNLQKTQERFIQTSKTLRTYLLELTNLQASPERRYESAMLEFRRVASLASQGNEGAIEQLDSVGKEFLDASREYNASSLQFQKDRDDVIKAVTDAISYTEQQVDTATKQLQAIEQSHGVLLGISTGIGNVTNGVLSVAQGINNLITATNNYQAAVNALAAGKEAAPVAPVAPTVPAPVVAPIPMPKPIPVGPTPTAFVPTVPGGRMGYNPFQDETYQVLNEDYSRRMIRFYYQQLLGREPENESAYIGRVAQLMGGYITADELAYQFRQSQEHKDLLSRGFIPGFAKGGTMSAGLSLVGEYGPELVSSGGGYVSSAGATANFFKTIKDAVVITSAQQMELLKEQVGELQALVRLQSAANRELITQLSEIRSETSEATRIAKVEASA